MADAHVRDLQSLLDRLPPRLTAGRAVECKRFFNGAAAYAGGRIFMTLTPVGLALKLPEPDRARLLAEGGWPLRYFPKAPIKKEYVVLPDNLTEEALGKWIEASLSFARAG